MIVTKKLHKYYLYERIHQYLFFVLFIVGAISLCYGQTVTGYASLDGSGSHYLAGGTTGGAGGTIVTVNDIAGLEYYAEQTGPYIIQVRGQLVSNTPRYAQVQSNKTIIGLGNDAAIINFGLSMDGRSSRVSNIIIKNLTFRDYYMMGDYDGKANDYDCIALRATDHVWIDHCHLSRAGDGLLDMTYGSGYVTVSWTIFSHHNKTSITGGQSVGTFTYDHCWFNNTTQRNVSAEYADVHAFNCYHLGVRSYCMLSRTNTQMLLENIYFKQSDDPYYEEPDPIQANGCLFESITGRTIASGNSFVPPYSYTLDPTADVPAMVTAGAGPGGFQNKVDGDVILINFRPSSSPDVKGYLSDEGYAYANRGNGYSYGWNATNTANAFWRETMTYKEGYTYDVPVDADFRQNGIITTANSTRYWEIGLPDGYYQVHLVCGDPGDPREITPANNVARFNRVIIEGILFNDPDGALLWDYDEYTTTVNITDGRLTIEQFLNEAYSAALCYVDIRPATEPVTVSNPGPGLKFSYYEGQWDFLPDFDALTPVNEGAMLNFDLLFVDSAIDDFAAVFEGFIDIPQDGLYTFSTDSADGSRLYIGNTEVVDNDGIHSEQFCSGSILLAAGKHPIRLEMFMVNNGPGNRPLYVYWDGPGTGGQNLIPREKLSREWIYGDFTGDEIVDGEDLGIFGELWLVNNCTTTTNIDKNGDCLINFYEFGLFAENWLMH